MPDVGQSIAAVLLAAGGSTRMGTTKQLLPYRGCTLLRRAAEVVVAADCRPTAVVLGADGARLEQELTRLPVSIIHNLDWEKGIGTSIRMGVQAIRAIADDAAALIITVCDQPLLHLEVIQQLCAAFWAQRHRRLRLWGYTWGSGPVRATLFFTFAEPGRRGRGQAANSRCG
jgi:molybdenum cofactor cytidylyltransferase